MGDKVFSPKKSTRKTGSPIHSREKVVTPKKEYNAAGLRHRKHGDDNPENIDSISTGDLVPDDLCLKCSGGILDDIVDGNMKNDSDSGVDDDESENKGIRKTSPFPQQRNASIESLHYKICSPEELNPSYIYYHKLVITAIWVLAMTTRLYQIDQPTHVW